jgi:DNA/RNA endonuclease YhcR with UshA esterase domain
VIILLVWQDVMEKIADRYDLLPGGQVRVTGKVGQYQGDLQLEPHRGTAVSVLAPGPRLPIEERQVHDITPADEGRVFVIEGHVVRTEADGWVKLWISDGSAEILVFVPERTVPYLDTDIAAGVRVRVTGHVAIYQSTLEVIPLAGADVEIL